jgi:hypothetical protein
MDTIIPISRWDVIMKNNSLKQIPVICITPNKHLLEYFKYDDTVSFVITGTNTAYDNVKMLGSLNTELKIQRPNYFGQTGYYVIELDHPWVEHPLPTNMGSLHIKFENDKNSMQQINDDISDDNTKEFYDKATNSMNMKQIVLNIICILLLILVVSCY